MADIYVRPYGSGGKKSPKAFGMLVVLVIFLGAAGWWWVQRSDEPAVENIIKKPPMVVVEKVLEVKGTSAAPTQVASQVDAQKLFSRAQALRVAGKLSEATQLLDEVVAKATDESLKNNALRVQGRLNVQLFLSSAPSSLKKNYIIQPGDSLDRIARQNRTTVALIRRMNQIDGNLIYPGARLALPAAPFVVNVDKSERTMDLTMNGRCFKHYAVGLGRYGKTPLGTFKTVVHQTNPDWSPPSGGIVPYGDPRNVLGTRWISIHDETQPDIKGFGIHGTSDRESIGHEASNGCIRMLNEDVEEVFLFVPRGTQVVINP